MRTLIRNFLLQVTILTILTYTSNILAQQPGTKLLNSQLSVKNADTCANYLPEEDGNYTAFSWSSPSPWLAPSPYSFCQYASTQSAESVIGYNFQASGGSIAGCSQQIGDALQVNPQPERFVPRDDVAACTQLPGIFNCTDAAWLYCQQFPNPADCYILGWNPSWPWFPGDAHEVAIRPGPNPGDWCVIEPEDGTQVYCWNDPNGPRPLPDAAWGPICQLRQRMGLRCNPNGGPPNHTDWEILPGNQYDYCGAKKRRWDECGIPNIIQDYCDYINQNQITCLSLPTCDSLYDQRFCRAGETRACRRNNDRGSPEVTFLSCCKNTYIAPGCVTLGHWCEHPEIPPTCSALRGQPCDTPGSTKACRTTFSDPMRTITYTCIDGFWGIPAPPTPTPASQPSPSPTPGPGGGIDQH